MVPKDSNRWPWLCLVGRPCLTPSREDNFSFPFARSLLTIKVEDFQLKNTRSALIFSLSSKTLFSSAPWHPSDKCWFRTDLHSFFSKELKNHVWLRIVEIQLDELEPTQTNNRSSLSLLLAHCLLWRSQAASLAWSSWERTCITTVINDVYCPSWPLTETLPHYCQIFFLEFLI